MSDQAKKILRILGGVALVFALIWWLFLSEKFLEIPKNFNYSAEINSIDNFYDSEKGKYKGPQYSVTEFSYKIVEQKNGNLLIKNIFDVKTPEGDPIFSTERLYGIDPKTGAHVTGYGDEDREGYLFAPRNLEKGKPFTYWHINYDVPAVMNFVAEEEINGLTVYHYQSNYGGEPVDQSTDLTQWLDAEKSEGIHVYPNLELWVEPVRGTLVSYQDDTTAYYYDTTTGKDLRPWNHFTNTFSETSKNEHASEAQKAKALYFIIKDIIPVDFVILSVLLLGITFWKKNTPLENKVKVPLVVSLFMTLVPIIGTLTATYLFHYNLNNQLEQTFNSKIQDIEETVTQQINSYVTTLQGTQGLFAASAQVTREEWHDYVNQLNLAKNFPSASGIGFIKLVKESEKQAFNEAMQAEGYSKGTIHPEGERGIYAPVVYLELVDADYSVEDFLGFDMYSETIRDQAILQARDTAAPSLSGKAALINEAKEDNTGFFIFVPIYEKNMANSTLEEREAAIYGYTYSRFKVSTLIEEIFKDRALPVSFQIYDGTIIAQDQLLYDSGQNQDQSGKGEYTKTEVVYLSGHPWTFHFTSNEQLSLDGNQRVFYYAFLVVGVISSAMVTLIYYALLFSRKRLAEDYFKRKIR